MLHIALANSNWALTGAVSPCETHRPFDYSENRPHFVEQKDPEGEQFICQLSSKKRNVYVHVPCREDVRGIEV